MGNLISLNSDYKIMTNSDLMEYHTNLHIYFKKVLNGGLAIMTIEKIFGIHSGVVVEIHNRGMYHMSPLDELDTAKMVSGESQSYSIGILSPDKNIDPDYVVEFEGHKYLKLGDVVGNINARLGENILITAKKAIKETTENGIKYTIKKMSVIKTVKDCDNVAKLLKEDPKAIFSKEMSQEGGFVPFPNKGVDTFPKKMQESFNKIIGKWNSYVIHENLLEGTQPQFDVRFDVGDHLEGFRLLTDDIKNLKDVECAIKLPHKKEWLNFEGKYNDKTFNIINKGIFSPVKVDDHRILLRMRTTEAKKSKEIYGRFSCFISDGKMLFSKIIGRPVGTSNLTGDILKQIWDLTKKGTSRMDISRELELSTRTVWKYQRSLGLI